jgi:hypothetical protein
MADVPVPGYQAFWTYKRKTLKSEFQKLVGQNSDAEARRTQLFRVLCDIEDVAGYTPASVGKVTTGKDPHVIQSTLFP